MPPEQFFDDEDEVPVYETISWDLPGIMFRSKKHPKGGSYWDANTPKDKRGE